MCRPGQRTEPGTRQSARACAFRSSSSPLLGSDWRNALRTEGPSASRGRMEVASDGVAIARGYDESVSQFTPELDPNEPRQLPSDFRGYEPIQPRGTNWRELGRRIWAPFAAIGAFLAKFGVGILKFKFLF